MGRVVRDICETVQHKEIHETVQHEDVLETKQHGDIHETKQHDTRSYETYIVRHTTFDTLFMHVVEETTPLLRLRLSVTLSNLRRSESRVLRFVFL